MLAHSGQQQNFALIPKLVRSGLAGLELNHPANSEKDKKIISEYAERYGLFLTGEVISMENMRKIQRISGNFSLRKGVCGTDFL